MRQMRRLMLRTRFLDLARRCFDIRFRLIPFLENDLVLAFGFAHFLFQRRHSRPAFEQRVRLHGAAAAENNSGRGNEFAIQRRHRQRRLILFRSERVIEFRENYGPVEQLTHERFDRARRNYFVYRPGNRAFRQTLADLFMS